MLCVYEDYYGDNDARELTHRMKDKDTNAIYTMAKDMAKLIHDDCVLIPVPNRIGRAVETLLMAQWMQAFAREEKTLRVKLENVLVGAERVSLYDYKKQGKSPDDFDFGFRLFAPVPKAKNIYLVDNVLATVTTLSAALKLVPSADVLVHSVDKKTFEQSAYRSRFHKVINEERQHLVQCQKQKNRLRL